MMRLRAAGLGAAAPADSSEGIQLASSLREREPAPYWWDKMPPGGIPFFVAGSAVSPAYGTQIQVASYQCPSNYRAVLKGILNVFDGDGFLNGQGQAFWTIDVDTPLAGVIDSSYPFDGYAKILTQMGSYANGLWRIPGGLKFRDGQTVRYKFQTVGLPVGVGGSNLTTCMLGGWIAPLIRT